METFLKAEGLVKRYGHISALRGIDLEIDHGESIVLLGPNGAGKSTLLGVLAGRVRPTKGKVVLGGEVLGKSVRARSLTGYLAHSSLLYSALTARENLQLYGKLHDVEDPGERSDEMLHFMGLWERRDDRVGGFSRGMEQRLSIARSLLHDPQLLLLDEPFSGLDYQSSLLLLPLSLPVLIGGVRVITLALEGGSAAQVLGWLGRLAASIGFILRREMFWDNLAVSAAEVGVLFTSFVLVTGPLWARPVWGQWWVWDPRLTTTLILWFLYVGYLVLRQAIPGYRGAMAAAVFAVLAYVDVPIVYFSVSLWRGGPSPGAPRGRRTGPCHGAAFADQFRRVPAPFRDPHMGAL